MRHLLLIAIVLLTKLAVLAQDVNSEDKAAAYTRTINTRAEKIVATLGISDSSKFDRIKTVIANQYRNLNEIHTLKNEKLRLIKAEGGEKDAINSQIKTVEDAAAASLEKLHKDFISTLSKELTPEQVIQVKDGMTYNVVNVTYNAYLDMLPRLTNEQKEQIYKWLIEAREYAMDAESSEKKHWWFGKYKGRINNYLSAAGYDMKKEGEEWQKRRNAARTNTAK